MDRRIFVKSILGVAGAAATVAVFTPRAEASPLLDQLKAMDAAGANPAKAAADAADLPAEGAAEAQYYYGPRRRHWGRPYVRRRYWRPVRRCRTFVNRWGRLVRRCW